MKNRAALIWGLILIVVGLFGCAVVAILAISNVNGPVERGWNAGDGPADESSSPGERIYYTGLDENGDPIPRSMGGRGRTRGGFGMMQNSACVDCHGEDGRGGDIGMMMGSIEIPDIRYSTLTEEHSENGESEPGWDDEDIKRAISEGMEPSGDTLRPPMPRWHMTDQQLDDIVDYLKELDEQ